MNTVIRKRYSSDFKAQALELVSLGKTVPQVAQELGIGTSILYRWAQPQGPRGGGGGGGARGRPPPTARGQRPPAHGERHFKKSRRHPRHTTPVQTRTMILQLHHQTGGSIRQICQALDLPRSSFYHAAQATPSQHEDVRLGRLIKEIFQRNRRRYGYRRIQDELRDHAIPCAASRLRRIMKQQGLRAIQPKNFLPKTSDGRADRPSLNLLANSPLPQVPDQAWAGDITFIPTSKIWLYLAVVIDLGSRRIIGWSLATHMRAELVVHALE
jgi:transposase-like protein